MSPIKNSSLFPEWDYLIITAANALQADAYRRQIKLRESLGLVNGVKQIIVIADPGDHRIGSGGSTVHCLLRILNLELSSGRGGRELSDWRAWAQIFERLRILIIHSGGDSRRLPPYGPCGKIFVPVPGDSGGALGMSLFDRLILTYLQLPRPSGGGGQAVVASGDVLLDFDSASVMFEEKGITGVGTHVQPELAKNHGVYCCNNTGSVRLFLQKPSAEKQAKLGAVNVQGQSILDSGILNFAPDASARLLELCGVGIRRGKGGQVLRWSGPVAEAIESTGLDIYREVCCALGRNARPRGYAEQVKEAGSAASKKVLLAIYHGLRPLPFCVYVAPRIRFLHFGTLRDLIESGRRLNDSETVEPIKTTNIPVNSQVRGQGIVVGKNVWVEGCRIEAPLDLAGDNVVVGLDVGSTLALPRGGSIDVLEGTGRDGRRGWFVRAYGTDDAFHLPAEKCGRLCGLPVQEWLASIGAAWKNVWPEGRRAAGRTVWNGRFFPIVRERGDFRNWLWLLEPATASPQQKAEWLAAERYSLEEIADRADLEAFHARRLDIRGELARRSLAMSFGPESELSAAELAFMTERVPARERADWIVSIVREAARGSEAARLRPGLEALGLSRILHTAGTVIGKIAGRPIGQARSEAARDIIVRLNEDLTGAEKRALREIGTPVERTMRLSAWAEGLREAAFRHLGGTIVHEGGQAPAPPKNVLRRDEIVWGRAPARLDLGGGWTDTPPYSLERGGCVINAAVDLNGQSPIQAYGRVIDRREIRINSIDLGASVVVKTLGDLLDFRQPGSQFALAKAALALAGFSPGRAAWPEGVRSLDAMLRYFGGGIELTTLAAIPSGSGLGTSSIMGAVLTSVIGRMIGRPLSPRGLFHTVLKLEQELTTGGGWQDQIGGAIEGVKMITSEKGLVPDPRIRFVPADLLDPAVNGGRTLLYYTGLRRLAKDILHEVVGRYLDRDRAAMETLRRLHAFPPLMAEALAMRDAEKFGELIDVAWKLNVDIDPDHTTPVIEDLKTRIRQYVRGAKLLGAGGGGFLLMACKSTEDAAAVKRMLEKRPPNDKARFFDYSINRTGLVVTVC